MHQPKFLILGGGRVQKVSGDRKPDALAHTGFIFDFMAMNCEKKYHYITKYTSARQNDFFTNIMKV